MTRTMVSAVNGYAKFKGSALIAKIHDTAAPKANKSPPAISGFVNDRNKKTAWLA